MLWVQIWEKWLQVGKTYWWKFLQILCLRFLWDNVWKRKEKIWPLKRLEGKNIICKPWTPTWYVPARNKLCKKGCFIYEVPEVQEVFSVSLQPQPFGPIQQCRTTFVLVEGGQDESGVLLVLKAALLFYMRGWGREKFRNYVLGQYMEFTDPIERVEERLSSVYRVSKTEVEIGCSRMPPTKQSTLPSGMLPDIETFESVWWCLRWASRLRCETVYSAAFLTIPNGFY